MRLFTRVVVLLTVMWMIVPSTALGSVPRRYELNEVGLCEEPAPITVEALVGQYCTDPHDYLPMLTYVRTQHRAILESLRVQRALIDEVQQLSESIFRSQPEKLTKLREGSVLAVANIYVFMQDVQARDQEAEDMMALFTTGTAYEQDVLASILSVVCRPILEEATADLVATLAATEGWEDIARALRNDETTP